MSRRHLFGSVTGLLAVLALLAACGGSAPPATTSETPATPAPSETPAQAANDPARPEAPAAADQAGTDQYDPATAAGAIKGVPAPTNTAPIEAVANFFTELPGFDLTPLSKLQREKFLHRVNSELCTCGCKNDTLARCLVNDPKCPVVKGMVQTVYDETRSGK